MKILASFLLVLFTAFLSTPTFITCIDKRVDVSMAFTACEEENSSNTPQLVFEYTFQDVIPNTFSFHFSQEQSPLSHSYKEGYRLIFLDILSPPPKQA